MSITIPIEELLEQQLDILGHTIIPNAITEIRVIQKQGYPKQFFVSGKEEFINEVQKHLQSGACYVGINPRSNPSGYAKDISHLSCIVIDLDPIRPKDTASTDAQHKEALELGTRIANDLRGYSISSGGGCHVYFPIVPIKVENVEGITNSIKNFIDNIRNKYGTETIKIDPIFDLPRVIRVWGSINGKSNRLCSPLGDIGRVERLDIKLSQAPTEKIQVTPVINKEGTEARFDSLLRSNKRLKEICDGSSSHTSKSESDYEFVAILAQARFSIEDIKSLYPRNPSGNQTAKKGDVERIVGKVFKDNPAKAFSLTYDIEKYKKSLDERRMGIRTGFQLLDEVISGLQRGKLYILPAARPNKGKTTLLTQILHHISAHGETCLFYPTEVGPNPIIDKIVSRKTGVALKKFQNGTFTQEDKSRINSFMPSIAGLPLIVVEGLQLTPEVVLEGVKQYAPTVLCVDFFQAFSWRDSDSVGEKNAAVKMLKQIAIDYNIPVILTSQLNRNDKYDMSCLKGCGGLEELADVIAFLVPGDKPEHPFPTDLRIVKSKYSATGTIKMLFNRTIGEFTEVEVSE